MLSGSQHCVQASDRAGIISVAAKPELGCRKPEFWRPSADPDLHAFAKSFEEDLARWHCHQSRGPIAFEIDGHPLWRQVFVMRFRATKIANVFVIELDAQH